MNKKHNWKFVEEENGNELFPFINVQNFLWSINTNGLQGDQNRNILCGQAIRIYDGFHFDFTKMQNAVQKLYDDNDALRTILVKKDGMVYQKVISNFTYELIVRETEGDSVEERLHHALEMADREIDEPLSEFESLLSKILFFKIDEDDYLLVIYLSHMIADGVSVLVTANKLLNLYKDSDYSDESLHYSEYRKYEENLLDTEEGKAHVSYWNEKMKNYREMVHEPDGTEKGGLDTIPLSMMQYDKKEIDKFARSFKTSSFTIFTVAYHYMLSKYYKVRDTATGFAIANRRNPDFMKTIGLMAKCIPVRVIVNDNDTFADLIRRVAKSSEEDSRHQEFADYGLGLRFKSSLQREGASFMRMPSVGGKYDFPYLNFNRHLSGMWNFAVVINEIEKQWTVAFAAETSVFSEKCIITLKEYFRECVETMLKDPLTNVKSMLEAK